MDKVKTQNKIIVISAPSGAGKTTIVKKLLSDFDMLSFSVSVTTRNQREGEIEGKDYYFISTDAFNQNIKDNNFIEWEMVYEGKYYGTLKNELARIWNQKKTPLLELDVQGSIRLQKEYQDKKIYSIFVQIPSIESLKERLVKRATEDHATIETRITKALYELDKGNKENFNLIVLNDDLERCYTEIKKQINKFLIS